MVPLSPARYKVQFTASAELHDKLERLQALMRSEVPDGDLSLIIEQAVTEKLERLEAKRYATTTAPRKALRRPMPLHLRGTSLLPSGVLCMSATEIDAATWMRRGDDARLPRGSSSTIGIHSASAATTGQKTSV